LSSPASGPFFSDAGRRGSTLIDDDAIEDCEVPRELIAESFGEDVGDGLYPSLEEISGLSSNSRPSRR
jgi:hypothetical protein